MPIWNAIVSEQWAIVVLLQLDVRLVLYDITGGFRQVGV
jgi:hypothetical protein